MSAQTIVGIPGLDVDLTGASARMRAGDDAIHEPTAVLKTAVSRTCDTVAAPLRRAAEAAIAAGSPAAADLPFCRGLVAERDGSWHAVAVVTSPDLARSATAVAALAALNAGSVAFPGFGGGFGTTAGGRLEVVAAPPFATRRLRDATLAEAVLAEAECTIGGEAECEAPCPAGHAGPDGMDAAGIALDSRGVSP